MQLTSCKADLIVVSAEANDHTDLAGRRIIRALCRQYEFGRAIRQGTPSSQYKGREIIIWNALHENFAFLRPIHLSLSITSKCDVCQAIKVVNQMAKSVYNQEFAELIARTRTTLQDREWFDLAAALRVFRESAGAALNTWTVQRVHRVEEVMGVVQSLRNEPTTCSPNVPGSNLANQDNLLPDAWLEATRKKMARIDGTYLRILP